MIAAFVVGAACSSGAQDKPPAAASATKPAGGPPAAEPGTLDAIFNGRLPEAIAKSKLNVNARLRYEFADQDSITPAAELDESDAFTLRTRFGLTTAPLYGFQGMLEGENIAVLGPAHNFNAAGSNGQAGRTVVADPPTTELNQGWLSYTNWGATLKGGRQRIALDNHRFIGDVGWRQNMQTFDAASLEVKSIKNLSLFYGYIWEVNRIFGEVSGLPAANTDFKSESHLMNLSYGGWKYAKFTGYGYLLDLENAAPASLNNSTATFGASMAGSAPVHEQIKLEYRAEFAWQLDYADSLVDYDTEYFNVELGAHIAPFLLGAGYELLGSDSGQGFKTPLATLHAFNGWADVFLNTPGAGLRDLYGFAQVTVPGGIPLRVVYHKFDAVSGGGDFGWELDVIASKKLGKHWTALAKYALYDGMDAAPPALAGAVGPGAAIDVQKFWLQLEFNF